MNNDLLVRYYMEQAGSGIGEFYSGPIYQRGYGIGSFLGGLFKTVIPILKKGGAVVGKEVLKNGANFLNDLRNSNINPNTALNNRARETVENLKRKLMYGDGFKVGRSNKKRQLGVKPRKVKAKRNNKAKVKPNNKAKVKPKNKTKVKRNNKVKSEKVVKRKKNSEKDQENSDIFSFY